MNDDIRRAQDKILTEHPDSWEAEQLRKRRTSRSLIGSVACALCANDESEDPDYGNDHLAELIVDQLIADGHEWAMRLGRAVESTERSSPTLVGTGWNACLSAIYDHAERSEI